MQGPALSAFEQELARRSAEGEAAADREETLRLRALLQDHYQAPALTNPDFFSHQLRERIDAERTASGRGRETSRRVEAPTFSWALARLVGLGAMSLFAAAAIYYGMMPPHTGTSDVASIHGPAAADRSVAGHDTRVAEVPAAILAPAAVAPADSRDADGTVKMVQLAPTPVPFDLAADNTAHTSDQVNKTAVTPLHYNQPNVNVLWLNGLEYLPSVSEDAETTGAADAAASPVPAPSASGAP